MVATSIDTSWLKAIEEELFNTIVVEEVITVESEDIAKTSVQSGTSETFVFNWKRNGRSR